MVKDIAFFAYSVRYVPRARAFYSETLGFEPGSSTGAAFEVDDMTTMRERLKASGVEVGEVHEFPACITCFARDPEGNRFALHQRRTPAQENVA